MFRSVALRGIERGAFAGPLGRAAALAWGAAASRWVARPLALPSRAAVVTVGGATLGGSGKTRVALACARELAGLGARVALVGHAYRARPARPRVVRPGDALGEVGDEALACARSLEGIAPVVVAPTRQAAVDLAATLADVVVVDGPLQTAPRRAALALLAVDERAPWGTGAPPPVGELRAPREALLAHADLVVPVDATPSCSLPRRFALFTAVARPERLVRALPREPIALVAAPDHGPARRVAAEVRRLDDVVEAWVATPKCAIHLASLFPARPVHVLPDEAPLTAEVSRALEALARRKRAENPAPAPTCAP